MLVSPGVRPRIQGSVSDAEGISTIFYADRSAIADDAAWELIRLPVASDGCGADEIAESFARTREAWIDVANGRWVAGTPADDVGGAPRIPLWSTPIKARRGGDFYTDCVADPGFAATSKIANRKLAPQGSRDKPWILQIDHGWLCTYVQFHGYDPTVVGVARTRRGHRRA